MLDRLQQLLVQLRLKGMASCLKEVLQDAERNGACIQDVFHQLLTLEHQYQTERALVNRLKSAKLPWDWSLDTFPFKQQPTVKRAQIMSLAKLDFIKNFENVTFIGDPGTGKSGIAIGLLRLALTNGYRGRFYNAQDLLDELYTSLADRSTSRLLKTIAAYDILVIDELGYLTLSTEQINIFFKLIDMRYQKKATIITTNLQYQDWYDVFKNKALVDAMLDRLKHHCTTIYINGPSLRTSDKNHENPLRATKVSDDSILPQLADQ